jgi:signal transduction histidine kinase
LFFFYPYFTWLVFLYGLTLLLHQMANEVILKNRLLDRWMRGGIAVGFVLIIISLRRAEPAAALNEYLEWAGYFTVMVLFAFILRSIFATKERRERFMLSQFQKYLDMEKRLLGHSFNNFLTKICNPPEGGPSPATLRSGARIQEAIRQLATDEKTDFDLRTCLMAIDFPRAVKFQGNQLLVQAHQVMLVMALENIINNALESGATDVTVRFQGPRLTVADNGPGFDTSRLRPGWTTKPQGHGYGLYYSQTTCAQEGLALQIRSSAGQGTVVEVDCAKIATNQPVPV